MKTNDVFHFDRKSCKINVSIFEGETMSSWLTGGLKSSLSTLKDQVTNSINDVLQEFEEDETDSDLLDETSGRDAETRLLLAIDRLRDVRQSLDDRKKELSQVRDSETRLIKEKQVRKCLH